MNLITDWAHKFETYLTKNHDDDGSHDVSHFKRVWKTAQKLMTEETDELVILASCYFHDIVCYPKNHPKRSCSSREAALITKVNLNPGRFDLNFSYVQNIIKCIEKSLFDKKFITKVKMGKNPYYNGNTSKKVVKILENLKFPSIQKVITY